MTKVSEAAWALARGECYITPDGWCFTHSTSEGPVYCAESPERHSRT